MKNVNILLIVILVTVLSCSFDKKSISTKILVESRTIKYKYVDGKLDSTVTLYERIIFDNQGRDSIIENYNDSGSLFLRTNLYYDTVWQ